MASMENAVAGRTADDRGVKGAGNGARPFMASFLDHLVRNGIVAADQLHVVRAFIIHHSTFISSSQCQHGQSAGGGDQ